MKLNNRNTQFIITLLLFAGMYLVCNDPQKPDFGDPPDIGNNKHILADNPPVLNDTLILYLTLQTGAEPLTYTWYKNDTVISRASSDSLKFEPLKFSDTGTYHCVVTNILGSDASVPFKLDSINEAPVIGNNKQVYVSGTPYKDAPFFMYIITTGTKPLTYQWLKDSIPLLTGSATDDTLKFTALQHADTGDYQCVVMNDFGSDTSIPHELSLSNQPPQWSVDTMHITATESQLCTLNVKDSCSDPDGDTLSFKLLAGAPAGDTVIGASYQFTPGYTDAGTYVVAVQASDGKITSTGYIKLIVLNKNRPPSFFDTLPKPLYSVAEGAKLIIAFKAVDPDGDSVFYKITRNTLPDNGPVVFTDSRFEWQSTHDDSGMYSVEISATDKTDTTKASVSVAVGNVNLPPQIKIGSYKQGDTLRVKESDTLKFTVTATDPDAGDVPVLLSPKNKPAGAVFDTSTGNFSYIPAFSVSTGIANTLFLNVRFFATDNKTQYSTDSFYIHIQVLDSNSAPKWTVNSADLAATEGKTLSYNMSAVFSGDNEGDKITFAKTFGTFNTDTSQWSWTPTFISFQGKDTVCTITAIDNHNPPASSNLALTVSIADSVVPAVLSKPSNITYKSMKIAWTHSTEAQFGAYKLYYDVSSNVTETSNLAATITDIYKTVDTLDGLNENTRYYVRVFTYNTNATKSGSNVVDSTTPVLYPPVISIGYPVITRDSCFIKEISPTITGTVFTAASIKSMSATINGVSATVNLQANDTWSINVSTTTKKQWNKIVVQAVDIKDKSTDTTLYMYYMPTLTPPTGLDTSNTKNRGIKLSWNPVTYCSRYRLYRSLQSGGPYTCIADTTAISFTDTLIPINTQYWYKVKGYYAASGGFNMKDSTDFSGLATGKTKNWFFVYFNSNVFGQGKCVRQTADSGYIVLSGLSLLKTNTSGDTTWTNTYTVGGDLFEVEQTADGGFITVGYTESATAGGRDVYLLKTDREGNISSGWPKKYGGVNNEEGRSVEQTSDGGYIITGYSASLGAGKNDVYVLKTDADGNISSGWIKTYGGQENETGHAVIQTTDGGFAICGESNSFSSGETEIYLIKTNAIGDTANNAGWIETYGDGAGVDLAGHFIFETVTGGYVIASTRNSWELYFMETTNTGGAISSKTFNDITPSEQFYCVYKAIEGFIITGNQDVAHSRFFNIDINFNKLAIDKIIVLEIPGFNTSMIYARSIQQTYDNGYVITGYMDGESGRYLFMLKTDEKGYYEY